jgi:hypothetical protein
MLSLNISYWDLIKFPYSADTIETSKYLSNYYHRYLTSQYYRKRRFDEGIHFCLHLFVWMTALTSLGWACFYLDISLYIHQGKFAPIWLGIFFYCFNYPIWLVNILNLFLLEARILWCSQSDNRSENDLAKFGYILNTKANYFFLKQNPSIFLATYWNLSKTNLTNLKKHSSKSGKFGSFFLMKNPLYRSSKSYFSGQNLVRICQ